jgi:hypothetical protein
LNAWIWPRTGSSTPSWRQSVSRLVRGAAGSSVEGVATGFCSPVATSVAAGAIAVEHEEVGLDDVTAAWERQRAGAGLRQVVRVAAPALPDQADGSSARLLNVADGA